MHNFFRVFGFNSSGVPKGIRVNANDQLQVEVGGAPSVFDPVFLSTAANTAIWDPAGGPTDIFSMEFKLINVTTSAATATLGIDVDNGGTLAGNETIIPGTSYSGGASSSWEGPYYMTGDDVLRGNSDTGSAITIHMRIKQL